MPAVRELPKEGDVLAGKYKLARMLGKGGMGVVFEAKHLRLGQRVAIKFLKADLLDEPDCVMRFEREARAAARLQNRHVARVFDVDSTPQGVPFMVMEFLEGHDLQSEIFTSPKLEVTDAVDIVLQACSAMSEAHALGVVHRDLKPANLFLCDKPPRMVKVLDFGVSKIMSNGDATSQLTKSTAAIGTPRFMSPEQVFTAQEVDTRSDIWALGVILYKLLSGEFPFDGATPVAIALAIGTHPVKKLADLVTVPASLDDAIMKTLAKDPRDRWQSVDDFARAIEPFGSGKHTFAPSSARAPEADDNDTATMSGPLVTGPEGEPTVGDPSITVGSWAEPSGLGRAAAPARGGRWKIPVAVVGAILLALVVVRVAVLTLRHPQPEANAAEAAALSNASVAPPAAASDLPVAAPSAASSAPSAPSANASASSSARPAATPRTTPRNTPGRPQPSAHPTSSPTVDPNHL